MLSEFSKAREGLEYLAVRHRALVFLAVIIGYFTADFGATLLFALPVRLIAGPEGVESVGFAVAYGILLFVLTPRSIMLAVFMIKRSLPWYLR